MITCNPSLREAVSHFRFLQFVTIVHSPLLLVVYDQINCIDITIAMVV